MSQPDSPSTSFIAIVPDPDLVRMRLGQAVREAQILRQQLRASERAARERQQQTGDTTTRQREAVARGR